MQFASFTFLFLCFPLALAVFYLVPVRARPVVLLLTNVLFVLGGGLLSALVLFLLTIGTYGAGLWISHLAPRRRLSMAVTALVTVLELGLVVLLRSDLLQRLELGDLYGVDLFPVGLSFFVLQCLDYCFEVRRGKCPPQRRLLALAGYLLFYPRLIMGPVVPYRVAMKQTLAVRCDIGQIGGGMLRLLIGLGKKLLLADWVHLFYMAIIQAEPGTYSTPVMWLGALARLVGLYLEFSGYGDMAIGLAQCYGIRLPESYGNTIFYPTISRFADQWNRTVVQWFFHNVGTHFHGRRRPFHVFAVVMTWGCIGLWYDVGVASLFWGMGIGLCIGIEYLMGTRIRYPMLRYVMTLALLCMGVVLAAQPEGTQAFSYLRHMLELGNMAPTDADGRLLRGYVLVLAAAIYAASGNWRYLMGRLEAHPKLAVVRQPVTFLAAVVLLVLDAVVLISFDGTASFQLLL